MKRRNTSDRASSKRMRAMKIDRPSTPPIDATTILDLNDDCLFEVYTYLNLLELASVADVCSRLRSSAQMYFGRSKLKNFIFPGDIQHILPQHEQFNGIQLILKVSHVLRNFGAFIVNFSETDNSSLYYRWDAELQSRCRSKIVELVAKYCVESLIGLSLSNFALKNEDQIRMRPVFGRLQKIELYYCHCTAQFLEMLPKWGPQIQEMVFEGIDVRFSGLRQRFPKLTKISLLSVNFHHDDIKEFLKNNPQLKEFHFTYRTGPDTRIFQYIGQYATEIETLQICLNPRFEAIQPFPLNDIHFDQLRHLKSITLFARNLKGKSNHLVPAICDIGAAQIPLKMLFLASGKLSELYANRFVDGISKVKTLETLDLELGGLNGQHIIRICTHLSHLSKLGLRITEELTAQNILDIVRIAGNLRWLDVSGQVTNGNKTSIEVDFFLKLAQIVENRAKKTHLQITLDQSGYSVNIPRELAKAHNESLSIV